MAEHHVRRVIAAAGSSPAVSRTTAVAMLATLHTLGGRAPLARLAGLLEMNLGAARRAVAQVLEPAGLVHRPAPGEVACR